MCEALPLVAVGLVSIVLDKASEPLSECSTDMDWVSQHLLDIVTMNINDALHIASFRFQA
jgi:hypothetical protein